MPVEPGLGSPDRVERMRAFERDVALARIDDELRLCARGGDRVEELFALAGGVQRSSAPWMMSVGVVHRWACVTGERSAYWLAGSFQSPIRIASSYLQTSDVRWNDT